MSYITAPYAPASCGQRNSLRASFSTMIRYNSTTYLARSLHPTWPYATRTCIEQMQCTARPRCHGKCLSCTCAFPAVPELMAGLNMKAGRPAKDFRELTGKLASSSACHHACLLNCTRRISCPAYCRCSICPRTHGPDLCPRLRQCYRALQGGSNRHLRIGSQCKELLRIRRRVVE